MIKFSFYDGKILESIDVDGVPHAQMKGILELATPGSWSTYIQVINGDTDLQYDLDVKYISENYYVPVISISEWLYSLPIRRAGDNVRERFRIFRRDIEKVFRVTWGLPTENLVMRTDLPYHEWSSEASHTLWDMHNIFVSFGIPSEYLEGGGDEINEPLHYIEMVAASNQCGSCGYRLVEMINYVDDLPIADMVRHHINATLLDSIPEPTQYLDDYLDDLNTFIGFEASKFVGEYNAQ